MKNWEDWKALEKVIPRIRKYKFIIENIVIQELFKLSEKKNYGSINDNSTIIK